MQEQFPAFQTPPRDDALAVSRAFGSAITLPPTLSDVPCPAHTVRVVAWLALLLNRAELIAELIYKLNEMIRINNKQGVFFCFRNFRCFSDDEAR